MQMLTEVGAEQNTMTIVMMPSEFVTLAGALAKAALEQMNPPWRATPGGVIVACRLTPKGGRDAIDGRRGFVRRRRRARLPGARAARGRAGQRSPVPADRQGGGRPGLAARGWRRARKSRVKQIAVEGDAAALMAALAKVCG